MFAGLTIATSTGRPDMGLLEKPLKCPALAQGQPGQMWRPPKTRLPHPHPSTAKFGALLTRVARHRLLMARQDGAGCACRQVVAIRQSAQYQPPSNLAPSHLPISPYRGESDLPPHGSIACRVSNPATKIAVC